jgi:hypothetical protein
MQHIQQLHLPAAATVRNSSHASSLADASKASRLRPHGGWSVVCVTWVHGCLGNAHDNVPSECFWLAGRIIVPVASPQCGSDCRSNQRNCTNGSADNDADVVAAGAAWWLRQVGRWCKGRRP